MEVYDLLQKKGLINDSAIDKKIKHDCSILSSVPARRDLNP